VLANPQRPGGKHPDAASGYLIEIRRSSKEIIANLPDVVRILGFHRRFDGPGYLCQPLVVGQEDGIESIAIQEKPEA